MQGRQNLTNLERKGPHKSLHCKFCKPPGLVTPERPTRPQLETKTKIHLVHEAADLRLCNVHNEPGFPSVDPGGCVCYLEEDNICQKCVPDKSIITPTKKICKCAKGAKPHPSVYNQTAPKKKKRTDEDEEFWWEKYSREHDAIARETWAAYMAQRRKEKKLAKCQKREQQQVIMKNSHDSPSWYQKLSCQQMIYVEFLSTAIRLDSDENITDRTYFVLSGLGLYPRPKRKILKKCLSYCHYNSIHFLNQLHLLTKDVDSFNEKYVSNTSRGIPFSWNEKLIMSSICHLEFPTLLRELMDRLPPFPRPKILPQIPYPVFQKIRKKKYSNPYEEPLWKDRLNWVEKMKIDRLNRCRAYMDTKRVKIPPLALVKRPSLIDARPPFLNQIEANERASRRIANEKRPKTVKKHQVSTFNSAVDVTAIAGIEASEISTTEKADTDEICIFLKEPLKEPELTIEEDSFPEKEVQFAVQPEELPIPTGVSYCEQLSVLGEDSEEGPDIPFKTPPKTLSGTTIEQPCPPPDGSPGPPATHYDVAMRELDIMREEICGFHPFVSSSADTLKPNNLVQADDVVTKLTSAAEKLKKLAGTALETKQEKPKRKKKIKKHRKKKKRMYRKPKKPKSKIGISIHPKETEEVSKIYELETELAGENEEEGEEEEEKEEEEEEEEEEDEEEGEEENDDISIWSRRKPQRQKLIKKESEISDPDPDSRDEWSTRPPCTPKEEDIEETEIPTKKQRTKRKKKVKKIKKKTKRTKSKKVKESNVKTKESSVKDEKPTTIEGPEEPLQISTGQLENKEKEPEEVSVYKGGIKVLLKTILQDLAEEGYISASYQSIHNHPDINQLILYLQGEILTEKQRGWLHTLTKSKWTFMKGLSKFPIPELGVSPKRASKATWNDKKWVSQLTKSKKDEFYFKIAKSRAEYGLKIYETLNQSYFGTGRYLKIFFAYMTSKYEDAILRGID